MSSTCLATSELVPYETALQSGVRVEGRCRGCIVAPQLQRAWFLGSPSNADLVVKPRSLAHRRHVCYAWFMFSMQRAGDQHSYNAVTHANVETTITTGSTEARSLVTKGWIAVVSTR
nr:hypothetical protein CFP56_52844 [Quercus suber]